jgi:uncharacterized delta-60 repeat protein
MEKSMKKILFIFTVAVFATLSVIGINNPPPLSDVLDHAVHKTGVQSDGKVLLAGDFSQDFLIRLNSDNSIDTTFASNVRIGLFNRTVKDFAILNDDSILVVGNFTSFDQSLTGYIAKLDKNGNLDSHFTSNSGAGFDDEVTKIKVLDGKIILVGKFTSYNGDPVNKIAMLKSNGTLDSNFNKNGQGFDKAPSDIAVSPNRKSIYISGDFSSFNGDMYPYIVKMNHRGLASEDFGLIE